MLQLRPYQLELVDRVRVAYAAGSRSVVMQLGTGGGKTATAAALIARSVAKGKRVVFAAHLDALIDDTSDRITSAGIEHGIVQGDRPTNPTAPVQVASLATLHRRGERPPADLLIVDECHRALAATVREVLDGYPGARILGLTATPERGDGDPLGDVFEVLVCGPSVRELTAAGHLAPAIVLSPPAPTDGSLALDPVEAYATHAAGLPAMVFCRDAEHARDVATRLGDVAALVLGDTPRADRRAARARLAAGEPLVLVGCGVFLEGWDSPEVRAVVLARTFGVCGSFLQACGRALRTTPGKTHALIVDLVGAAILHGLPEDDRVWSLDGPARRTAAALAPLARCKACLAVFHAGPDACPRCGASTRGTRLPRRATRVERQELSRLDERPQALRDALALKAIENKLRASGRFPPLEGEGDRRRHVREEPAREGYGRVSSSADHSRLVRAILAELGALPGVVMGANASGRARYVSDAGRTFFVPYGWLAPGGPDILVAIAPLGRLVGLEVKTGRAQLRKDQRVVHAALRAVGVAVHVVRSVDEARSAPRGASALEAPRSQRRSLSVPPEGLASRLRV